MKEVDQTKTGKDGNCFQACIASMLDLSLEEVPDFVNLYSADDWLPECSKWLRKIGLGIVAIGIEDSESRDIADLYYTGYYIGDLKQATRPWNHVVIMRKTDIVHDPMPDNKRTAGYPTNAFYIVVDNMNKFIKYAKK